MSVMFKSYKRLVYTHPDLLARFCKVNLSNAKKIRPDFCFKVSLIYGDQELLLLLNVIENDCYFLGVHIIRPDLGLSWAVCKLFFL